MTLNGLLSYGVVPLFMICMGGLAASKNGPPEPSVKDPVGITDSSEEKDDGRHQGFFPMDNPQETKEGGRKLGEVDLYVGPSYSNVQGWGVGYNASLYTQDASSSSFGFKKALMAGGGFYDDANNHPSFQPQVTGIGKLGWGYYSLEGMKDGYGPHLLLDFLMINLSYLGNGTSQLSYTPALELGLHGRVASTKTFWTVQLEPSLNVMYTTGALVKIGSNGRPEYSYVSPMLIARAFLDTPLSHHHHLRLGGYIYETMDSLGNYGNRNLTQIVALALVKFGHWFYTGPQFIYYNVDKIANFQAKTYVPGTAEYSVSWLVGGALAGL